MVNKAEQDHIINRFYRMVPKIQAETFLLFRSSHPFKNLKVSHQTWEYISCGNGDKTILLLAGGVRFADAWFKLILYLEKEFKVIVPTIPCLDSIEDLLSGLKRILVEEKVKTTTVLGTSFGSLIAECLIRTHPEIINSLILSNSITLDSVSKRNANLALGLSKIYPTRLLQLSAKWNMLLIMSLKKSERAFWKAYWKEKTHTNLLKMSRRETLWYYYLALDISLKFHFDRNDLAGWNGKVYLIRSNNDLKSVKKIYSKLKKNYSEAQEYILDDVGHTPGYSYPLKYGAIVVDIMND